jgi:hypothetical protein
MGLLTEVIGIDLGLVHVAAPNRGVPGAMRRQCLRAVRRAARLPVVTD